MKRLAALVGLLLGLAVGLSSFAHAQLIEEGGRRSVVMGGSIAPVATLDFTSQTYTGQCSTFASCVTFSRADATPRATYFNSSGVLTTVASAGDHRFDYEPVTLTAKGGEWEEARTNLAKNSADIAGAAWTKGVGASIGAATTAPDGTTTAKLYQSTGANDYLYNTVSLTAAPFAASIYFKYSSGRWFLFRAYGTSGAQLWVDAQNGVLGTSSAYSGSPTLLTPTLTSIGGGWYRLTLGASAGASINYLQVQSVGGDASSVRANGEMYLWGAQVEAAAFPTSYIPTDASTVTRAADVHTAASLSSNPAIMQYRSVSTGTRARKVLATFSAISSEQNIWVEKIWIYPVGTPSSWLNAHLTVDGPTASLAPLFPRYAANDNLPVWWRIAL